MAKKRKLLKLSEDLEKAILYGIIQGAADPDVVAPEELGKNGRVVLASIVSFQEGGAKPPHSYESLLLMGSEALGAPKESLKSFLREIAAENAGTDAETVLRRVRDKQLVVDLLNEAAAQLQKGSVDVGLLASTLETSAKDTALLQAVAEAVKDGLPLPPEGLQLASLPNLNIATGGLIGMWAIAGEPGVGKSTMAAQIAIDVGRHTPVIWYDFENGFSVLMDRMRGIFKGDLEKIRAASSKLFIRDGIRSLDADLRTVGSPALIIIDSVQSLPTYGDQRRIGLDRWIHRLDQLKKRGFSILLISEVSRSQYNQDPYIGAFKETGDIEYKADAGIQMIPAHGDDVELHIVKNRHRKHKGLACYLTRKNDWWFKELSSNEPRELD